MHVVGEFMEDLEKPFRALYDVVKGDICHIVLVGTNPKYQRKGLSSRLCSLVLLLISTMTAMIFLIIGICVVGCESRS
jgi:ribosomal protein S18 acetylase RimI-like enzyme